VAVVAEPDACFGLDDAMTLRVNRSGTPAFQAAVATYQATPASSSRTLTPPS
jgi:hypothetical protein